MAIVNTPAELGILAYEGFGYTAGPVIGRNGGLGWADAWQVDTPSDVYAVDGSLIPNTGLGSLSISGGGMEWVHGTSARRNTNFTIGASGTEVWLSFVLRPGAVAYGGGLKIGDIQIGAVWSGTYGMMTDSGYYFASPADVVVGEVSLLVARMTFETNSYSVRLFLNPPAGAEEPDASAAIRDVTVPMAFAPTTLIQTSYTTYNAVPGIDEIRFGRSYGDVTPTGSVAPVPPPAPGNLSATAVSTSRVNLSWTDNADNEAGFKVYVSTDGATFTLFDTIQAPDVTSYSATGLTTGTQYWFRVTAFNADGESDFLGTATATTIWQATGLLSYEGFDYSLGTINGRNGGLGWADAWHVDTPSNVYAVEGSLSPNTGLGSLSTSGGGLQCVYGTVARRNMTSMIGTPGTEVWLSFVLRPGAVAYGGGLKVGELQIGAVWSGTYGMMTDSDYNFASLADVVVGEVSLLVARMTFEADSYSVRLFLNPPAGAEEPDASTAIRDVTIPKAFAPTTVIQTAQTTYNAIPRIDEIRMGSSYVDVTPTGTLEPVVPAAPGDLSATADSTSQINLTWTDNSDNETGFKVYVSTDGANFSLLDTIQTPDVTNYAATGLAAGTRYWFRVSAFSGDGESECSAPASARTRLTSALLAYEGFDYGPGTIDGRSGGIGWADAWQTNMPRDVQQISESVSPAGADELLRTSGSGVQWMLDAHLVRHTSFDIGAPGTPTVSRLTTVMVTGQNRWKSKSPRAMV